MSRTDTTDKKSLRTWIATAAVALGLGAAAFVAAAGSTPQDSSWDGVHAASAPVTGSAFLASPGATPADSSWD